MNKIEQPTSTAWTDLLTDMVDSMPAGVLLLTADGVIVISNRRAAAILGSDLAGRRLDHVLGAQQIHTGLNELVPMARAQHASRVVVTQNRLENGLFVAIVQDITEHDIENIDRAEASKLQAVGNVAARLAHQMRTPLAAALLNAEKIARKVGDDSLKATAASLLSQIHVLNTRIDALLRYVRGGEARSTRFDLEAAIRTAVADIAPVAKERGANVRVMPAARPSASGDLNDFKGAIISVIENALEAQAQNVDIILSQTDGVATIEINDDGLGIGEHVSEELTEPFFTTKPHGTGLGLSIAQDTFRQLGGHIEVVAKESGTSVFCTLKAA